MDFSLNVSVENWVNYDYGVFNVLRLIGISFLSWWYFCCWVKPKKRSIMIRIMSASLNFAKLSDE